MLSDNDIMSTVPETEPSGMPSVIRKRKRDLRLATGLASEIIAAQNEIEEGIGALEENTAIEPIYPLEKHPMFPFLFLVAGTIQGTHVDSFIHFKCDVKSVSEARDAAYEEYAAAHTAALEMLTTLKSQLDIAIQIEADSDIAQRLLSLLNSSTAVNKKYIDRLDVARQVRLYLSGTTGYYSRAVELAQSIKNAFGVTIDVENDARLDRELSNWLIKTGPALLSNSGDLKVGMDFDDEDYSIPGGMDGGEESMMSMRKKSNLTRSNQEKDDALFNRQPRPPSVSRAIIAQQSQREDEEARREAARAREEADAERAAEEEERPIFSSDAPYYISLDEISAKRRLLDARLATSDAIRVIMDDFDQSYKTNPPQNGAWDWLTEREREIAKFSQSINNYVKRVKAARAVFATKEKAWQKVSNEIKEAINMPPSEPISLNEEVTLALSSALAYLVTNDTTGYKNATVHAFTSADVVPKTLFAQIVGLFILRGRLDYPDRYRPVMTREDIANRMLNAAVSLAEYEVRGDRVVKTSTYRY